MAFQPGICDNNSIKITEKGRIIMYKSIFLDQCGYLPEMTKRVTFRSDNPVAFDVITSDGHRVFHGTASDRIENLCAGETDYVGDFSALTAPGRYRIVSSLFV